MSDRIARPPAEVRISLAVAATALLTLLAVMDLAFAQTAKPPPAVPQAAPPQGSPNQGPAGLQAAPEQAPSQSDQPGPPSPSRAENPGLFNEIGKLFDKSSSIFQDLPGLKSPQETIDDFNARAKGASDGLSQMATPLVVKGRTVCPVAANGAPDCKAASDKLCQSKGFKEGKSLDTDSAQSCPPAALLSGGNREPGNNCRTNNYVTRALCQ